MAARYYFADDNLKGLLTLLEQRPPDVLHILIGADDRTTVMPRLFAAITRHDRALAEWVVGRIAAGSAASCTKPIYQRAWI